jgi:hypothetical protein
VMGLVPRVALLGSLELSEPGKTRTLGDIPRPRPQRSRVAGEGRSCLSLELANFF